MTSSISFMTRMLSKFRKPEPAPKQDYSWMSEEQVEWQNVRAIEMELFDADAKPGSKAIFHHSV
jgi:hypothetical protein